MTFKFLWIVVIAFVVLEFASIPLLLIFTDELYQVLDGILIMGFIIYPILYVLCLVLMKKGTKKVSAVILLIPLVIYAPFLMGIQELLR